MFDLATGLGEVINTYAPESFDYDVNSVAYYDVENERFDKIEL